MATVKTQEANGKHCAIGWYEDVVSGKYLVMRWYGNIDYKVRTVKS